MARNTNRSNGRGILAALQAFSCVAIVLIAMSRISHAADQSADINMANHYLQAAKNGDVKAQYYMGALYSAGVGVSLSDTEGFHWFLLAAEHGNSEARIIVGASYATGRGVARSYIDAYKWTFVAAASGDLPETRNGARQLLDVLTARMSDNDIAEGRKLAQSILHSSNQPTPPASPQTTQPARLGAGNEERPPAPSQATRPKAPEQAQPGQAEVHKDEHVASKESPRGADYDRLTGDIDRDPSNADAYIRRSNILIQQREYALANQDLSEAIRLDPNNARALNNRCWTRVMLGQVDTAIVDCDEALKIQPDNVDALDSRGLANLKLSHFDRAVSDFNAALRLKPKLASSLYGRGIAHMRLGDKVEGGSDMASALEIDPKIRDQFDRYGIH
jgi:tetratricopeptide (TPR) repeat protein